MESAAERIKQQNQIAYASQMFADIAKSDQVEWRFSDVEICGKRNKYLNIPAAFDIETSALDCGQSIMYIWQLKVGDQRVIGRAWKEFVEELCNISDALPKGVKLKLFVHNLSYEFQFLSGILKFADDSVMIIKNRRILKATWRNIVFCCSYLLSNMSLERWAKQLGVKRKAVGLLDYSIQRFCGTVLSSQEVYYCITDVDVLCECIKRQNVIWNDDISTMPSTSTGYVRREAKAVLSVDKTYSYSQSAPDEEVFIMLREAFRGGNTHANRFYAGRILENVSSVDIASSYPAVMLLPEFPVGRAKRLHKRANMNYKKQFARLLKECCCLFRVAISNLALRIYEQPIPYISASDCRGAKKSVYDNGRVLFADYLEMTVTDVDWHIICSMYTFDYEIIGDVVYWKKDYLPVMYRDLVCQYYINKTLLKGGDEYEYLKFKNLINALFGMLVQNPAGDSIVWRNLEYFIEDKDVQTALDEYSKRAVMDYQKGVWVTALARRQLQRGLDLAGNDVVYCDTDSIKYLSEHDFSCLNKDYVFSAKDKFGNDHPIGVFEIEDDNYCELFRTWGAKKYAGEHDGKLKITVAGVNKEAGARELKRKGGLAVFKPGMIWANTGKMEVIYNDKPEVTAVFTPFGIQRITKNIYMRPTTYTLNITNEYRQRLYETNFQLD